MTRTSNYDIMFLVIKLKKLYIYKFLNKLNNKIYIGQSVNPEKRKLEHIYGRKTNNTYFDKALKKYGIENFDFEIIDQANSQREIDIKEREYITKYNSLKPNGYNILKGGREQQGAWNNKEIIEYDLDANYIATYESSGYYEAFVNKEYKSRSIRQCCLEHKHYKERIFRYKGDDIPEPYIKPLPNHTTTVYQFDSKGKIIGKYFSVTQASKETNTSRTTIMGCLNGTYKTANGYFWAKEPEMKISRDLKTIKKMPIYMCDDQKKILKLYYNAKEAERDNKFKENTNKQISKYLDKNKLFKGYYWYRVKYYEENIVPSLEIGRCND